MHPYKFDSRVTNETQELKKKYSVTVCCLNGNKLEKEKILISLTK